MQFKIFSIEVNKCSSNDCSPNATCTPNIENPSIPYTCTCKDGYVGNGKICNEDIKCKSIINENINLKKVIKSILKM